MTIDAHLEMSLQAGRDHRNDMARWLALELLMTDEIAMQDSTLQERLIALQDKIEAKYEPRCRVKDSLNRSAR